MGNGIFISYSHADLAEVDHVVDLLKETVNNPVWYDRNLRGGEEFFSTIAEQILQNEFFIFMVSDNSVKSRWCIQELEFAMSEGRKVMSVWVKECTPPPRVRLVIGNKQKIDAYRFEDKDIKSFFSKAVFNYAENDIASSQSNNSECTFSDSSKKYFLTTEEIRKVNNAMQLEKDGQYSKCMEVETAYYIGLGYDLGIEVDADINKACVYYKAAMQSGNNDAAFLYAMADEERRVKKIETASPADAEEQKKYKLTLIEQMDALVNSGSVMAMVYWGEEVYNGAKGISVDKEKAYNWWKVAADQYKHPQALYNLAFGYRVGEVLPKDTELAMMYSLRSAEYGFPRAFRNIAFLYKNDYKDIIKAVEYFKKAIDLGDYLSYDYLGNLLENKEPAEALKYYRLAVKSADDEKTKSGTPYYYIAFSYEFGNCGLSKDYEKAVDYYFKAIKRGHKLSKNRIAWCINKISNEKEQKLLSASELNCDNAEWYIGRIYEEKGDDNSVKTALEWYDKGVEKGSVDCIISSLHFYCWAFSNEGREKYNNREKSLDNFRLLFSIWDRDDDTTKEYYPLHVYNAVYAVELALDEKGKKPDKDHALYYFEKAFAFEDHIDFIFPRITTIAYAYVNPSISDFWTFVDYDFAEKLADLAFQHLNAYCAEQNEVKEESLVEIRNCYLELLNHCKSGLFASKADKLKRASYQEKINKINEKVLDQEKKKSHKLD